MAVAKSTDRTRLMRRTPRASAVGGFVLLFGAAAIATSTVCHRCSQAISVDAFLAPKVEGAGRRGALLVASGGLVGSLVAGANGGLVAPAHAVKYRPVTDQDLKRLKKGYDQLEYLLANWNKATRKCDKDQDKMVFEVQAGVPSPDSCIANPDQVRKFLGQRSMYEDLYNTQQLWIDISNTDLLEGDANEDFQSLVEDFEKYKQQAGDWAYTSSWGESNPGGGRDKVEDYLLRSKAEVVKATETLGKICKLLKLIDGPV